MTLQNTYRIYFSWKEQHSAEGGTNENSFVSDKVSTVTELIPFIKQGIINATGYYCDEINYVTVEHKMMDSLGFQKTNSCSYLEFQKTNNVVPSIDQLECNPNCYCKQKPNIAGSICPLLSQYLKK